MTKHIELKTVNQGVNRRAKNGRDPESNLRAPIDNDGLKRSPPDSRPHGPLPDRLPDA
jgi:hypothetical protein